MDSRAIVPMRDGLYLDQNTLNTTWTYSGTSYSMNWNDLIDLQSMQEYCQTVTKPEAGIENE